MNIFLIGYRCSGKTSVGRQLAEMLDWSFADTDELIVQQVEASIAAFVEEHSWAAFRAKESDTLARICQQDRQVVATGGGIVLDPQNIRRMKEHGWVVWLRVRPETVLHRMRRDDRTEAFRPPLTAQKIEVEIRETLSQRAFRYRQAMDFQVDSDRLSISDICGAIAKQLNRSFLLDK
jgi:shikimate kinase